MIINILLWMMWYCIVSNGAISYWIAWDSEAIFQIMHRKIIDRKAWYNNMCRAYWYNVVLIGVWGYCRVLYNIVQYDTMWFCINGFDFLSYYTILYKLWTSLWLYGPMLCDIDRTCSISYHILISDWLLSIKLETIKCDIYLQET